MRPTRTAADSSRSTAIAFASALCCMWTVVDRAQAAPNQSPLELEWRAPSGCPGRAEIESRVAARLGPRSASPAPLRASARIEPSTDGYRLQLQTDQGQRSLTARDCHELAAAAALILALLIDPEAAGDAADSKRVTPPKSQRERRWWVLIRPEFVGDIGTLPALAVGPGVSLGVRVFATSLEIAGTYLPAQSVHPTDREAPLAELRMLAAALGVCQALTHAPELSPCLRLEYGRLTGHGDSSLPNPRSASGAWALVLAGVRLGAELTQQVHATLELSLGLPLLGATFTVNSVGLVHETADVVGRLRAGLEIRL
jgi:hypothetical protein